MQWSILVVILSIKCSVNSLSNVGWLEMWSFEGGLLKSQLDKEPYGPKADFY